MGIEMHIEGLALHLKNFWHLMMAPGMRTMVLGVYINYFHKARRLLSLV
jgi:hypothetical protein